LIINYETAERIIKEKYQNNVNEFNCALGSTTYINNKDFCAIVDDFVHRLHTNLTNYPKFFGAKYESTRKIMWSRHSQFSAIFDFELSA
jgi:hypothetical protein